MNYRIKSAIVTLASIGALGFSAHASDVVRSACEANAANGFYNCNCVVDRYDAAASGLNAEQTSALADLFANTMGDTAAAMRFAEVSPSVMISLPLDAVGDTIEACMATNFEETIAAAEAEAEALEDYADAAEAAEDERVAAIGTADTPPEVTNPSATNPLAGEAGSRAATEFRDIVIADCMSFGNSPGYCGCHADETAELMTAEQRQAYFVSSKVNLRAQDGEIDWNDVDAVAAEELGTTERQVRDYQAQWNHMVQSQPYLDITYACQAYR